MFLFFVIHPTIHGIFSLSQILFTTVFFFFLSHMIYMSAKVARVNWDARMRLPGQRTRVRRGGTRRCGRNAADRASVPRRAASCHVAVPDSGQRGWNRRRRGPNRAESVCIGLYRPKRPIQAEIQKKKLLFYVWSWGWWYLCLIVLLIIFYFVLVSNLWVVF